MADEQTQRAGKESAGAPGAADAGQSAHDALNRAQQAVATLQSEAASAHPLPLPALDSAGTSPAGSSIEMLSDVHVRVKVELGRTRMFVEDVLRLNSGSVVELDKPAGDPVDIFVNERHVARGEVLVVNDSFCVRVSEIIQNESAA